MTKSEVLRRTWADISLDAIDYNFRKIRDAANGAMLDHAPIRLTST